MTNSAKSFSSIANISQLRETEAANALADSISRKQQAEKQLEQLQNYLSGYKSSMQGSNEAKQLFKINNEQVFIQRISFLIEKQKDEILQIQSSINEAIEDWKSNKIYNKVLNRLVNKYRDEQSSDLAKYEQKVNDDSSAIYQGKKLLQ